MRAVAGVMLFIFSCLLPSAGISASKSPDLVAAWRFESDAVDNSGGGNEGTLVNGASVSNGKFGKALTLDGSNDHVTVDSIATIKTAFTAGRLTVATWVKINSFPPSSDSFILTMGSTGGIYCLATVLSVLSNGKFKVGFQKLSSGDSLLESGVVSTGVWYHIAITFENSGSLRFYVNGSLVASSTPSVTLNSAAQVYNLRIGSNISTSNSGSGNCGGGPRYFNGQIDELRIYKRALGQGEIRSLMLNYEPGEF